MKILLTKNRFGGALSNLIETSLPYHKIRQLLYVVLIASVAAFFWWRQNTLHVNLNPHINYPDIILQQVRGVTMNDQGYPEYFLESPEIRHLADNQMTHFNKPIIQLADNKQQLWQIVADSANANTNFSLINLNQHVYIQQLTGLASDRTQIMTNALTLLPHQKEATNDEHVSILQNGNELIGDGLRIDLKSGLIRLLANIQAIYALSANTP